MRFLKIFSLVLVLGGAVSCAKSVSSATGTVSAVNITASGTLQKQGITTYMYGTHVLMQGSKVAYVLKSSTINLDPYVGSSVTITAVDTHYQAENGPDLYDVTSITR